LVGFAETLFRDTDGVLPAGDDHFAQLWSEAVRILE